MTFSGTADNDRSPTDISKFQHNSIMLHLARGVLDKDTSTSIQIFVCSYCGCGHIKLTQWSRAWRKSNSSSVHSSSVEDRDPTRVSHCSRRAWVWTQCSVSAHFCRTVSRGSWNEHAPLRIFELFLNECQWTQVSSLSRTALHKIYD